MRTSVIVAVLAAAGSTAAQFCAEAGRFGFTVASPTQLSSGQTFTITSNFTCSYEKGIRPAFVDYYIRNTVNNNGYEPNILVTRRAFSNPTKVDTFTATLPYYPVYFAGAKYSLQTLLTYPVNGTDGKPVYIIGQSGDVSLTITPNNS